MNSRDLCFVFFFLFTSALAKYCKIIIIISLRWIVQYYPQATDLSEDASPLHGIFNQKTDFLIGDAMPSFDVDSNVMLSSSCTSRAGCSFFNSSMLLVGHIL